MTVADQIKFAVRKVRAMRATEAKIAEAMKRQDEVVSRPPKTPPR
ncbi:MAG: hypothetical protein ACK4UQ_06535 [Brevundimonas sp.]